MIFNMDFKQFEYLILNFWELNILKARLQTQKARMFALEFCYFSFYLYKNA